MKEETVNGTALFLSYPSVIPIDVIQYFYHRAASVE